MKAEFNKCDLCKRGTNLSIPELCRNAVLSMPAEFHNALEEVCTALEDIHSLDYAIHEITPDPKQVEALVTIRNIMWGECRNANTEKPKAG